MNSSIIKKMVKGLIAQGSGMRSVIASQIRSIGNMKKLDEKEKGDERLYFNKSDEQLLKDLIKKLHKQTDMVEPTELQTQLNREKLKEILGDHNIDGEKNKDFVEELIIWKRQI